MAKYVHIFNMGLIVTEKCNLCCEHCMRGRYSNKNMSDEVIDATLDQVSSIGTLTICGGEPLLAVSTIQKILDKIVEKGILVEQLAIISNGLIYNYSFVEMLDDFYEYLEKTSMNKDVDHLVSFAISYDKYHLRQIRKAKLLRLYLGNIILYSKSKHFVGMNKLYEKPFSEGNARFLSSKDTVPLRPMNTYVTYVGSNGEYDEDCVCNIGPLVTVNVNGTITECDASLENQETKYNYGNVLTDKIEDVFRNKGYLVKDVYQMENFVERERIKYLTYKK